VHAPRKAFEVKLPIHDLLPGQHERSGVCASAALRQDMAGQGWGVHRHAILQQDGGSHIDDD
jgi:hypothetical protein